MILHLELEVVKNTYQNSEGIIEDLPDQIGYVLPRLFEVMVDTYKNRDTGTISMFNIIKELDKYKPVKWGVILYEIISQEKVEYMFKKLGYTKVEKMGKLTWII